MTFDFDFDDPEDAHDHLRGNFECVGGVYYPKEGYQPTTQDLAAVNYLFEEWDFGYSPTRPEQ